jgi:hypothetical protein
MGVSIADKRETSGSPLKGGTPTTDCTGRELDTVVVVVEQTVVEQGRARDRAICPV